MTLLLGLKPICSSKQVNVKKSHDKPSDYYDFTFQTPITTYFDPDIPIESLIEAQLTIAQLQAISDSYRIFEK